MTNWIHHIQTYKFQLTLNRFKESCCLFPRAHIQMSILFLQWRCCGLKPGGRWLPLAQKYPKPYINITTSLLTQISLLLCIYGQNQCCHPFASSVWCFIFFDWQEGKTEMIIHIFPNTSPVWNMVLKLSQYGTTMQGIINGTVNHFGLK